MNEPRWIRVTAIENLPLREGRAVMLGDREVALFNLGPSTELGAGPSTELGTGPSTELGTGPSTELGAGVRVLATDNQCPHQGGPLCDGIVTGESVVCPLHAWKVNLASGCIERPTAGKDHCVSTYPTRIENGIVSVALPIESVGRSDGPSGPSSILRSGEEAA